MNVVGGDMVEVKYNQYTKIISYNKIESIYKNNKL